MNRLLITQRYPAVFCWQYLHWPCCGRGLRRQVFYLLTWCGLLRIGEVIGAKRKDLILPQDGAPGVNFVLLRITTPKMRGCAARHQSARVDQSDVVEFLSVIFAGYQPDQLLWPMSSSTLRKRRNLLQTALGMPTAHSHDSCPYDLGSLRPGGATDMLQQFEDSELVRRRGRWVSHTVLEIYLQEVSTATFHTRLSAESRSKVQRLSSSQCQHFVRHNIPAIAWRHLWSTHAWNGLVGRLGTFGILPATKTSVARDDPAFGE